MGSNTESHTLSWILVFCLISSSLSRPSPSSQAPTTTLDPLSAILRPQNTNIRPGMLSNLKSYSLIKSQNEIESSDIPQSALRSETSTTSTAVSDLDSQANKTLKILPRGSKISINRRKNIISINSAKDHHRNHKTVLKCFKCIISL